MPLNFKFSMPVSICYTLLLILGGLTYFHTEWSPWYTVLSLLGLSLIYFIYTLFDNGIDNLIKGLILPLIFISICLSIPILGWIVLAFYIYRNIKKALKTLQMTIPDVAISIIYLILIFFPSYHGNTEYNNHIAIIYGLTVTIYCSYVNNLNTNSKNIYLRFTILFLSIPLFIIMMISIFSAIKSILNIGFAVSTSPGMVSQNVSGYTRLDGTIVSDYTRQVAGTITTVSVNTGIATAAITSAVVAKVSESIDTKTIQKENKNIDHLKDSFKTARQSSTDSIANTDDLLREIEQNFSNDAESSFYLGSEIPEKKLKNFINSVEKKFDKTLLPSEILFYYDETLLGSGKNGLAITQNEIIIILVLEETKTIPLKTIKNISINGKLNRKITIETDLSTIKFELTQGNKGAEEIAKAMTFMKQKINVL